MSKHLVESYKVASTLAAQRAVAVTAAQTVGYPANARVLPIGITLDTVNDTNEGIPVQHNGKAKLLFNDTVAAGALVASDSSGRGIPFTLANTTTSLTLASAYLGVLVGNAVAATGTIAEVLILPGYDRVGG